MLKTMPSSDGSATKKAATALDVLDTLFDNSPLGIGAGSLVSTILNQIAVLATVADLQGMLNKSLGRTDCGLDPVVWLGDLYLRPVSYGTYNALRAYGSAVEAKLSERSRHVIDRDFGHRVLTPTHDVRAMRAYPFGSSFNEYSKGSCFF